MKVLYDKANPGKIIVISEGKSHDHYTLWAHEWGVSRDMIKSATLYVYYSGARKYIYIDELKLDVLSHIRFAITCIGKPLNI